jgi:hypothetical protein
VSRCKRNSVRVALRALSLIVAVALVVALPATAIAANGSLKDPTASEYDSTKTGLSHASEGGGGSGGGIAGLPFTGLDVALLGVAATGLIATGLVLRRLSRPGDARR